jgi:hypothetical protein
LFVVSLDLFRRHEDVQKALHTMEISPKQLTFVEEFMTARLLKQTKNGT